MKEKNCRRAATNFLCVTLCCFDQFELLPKDGSFEERSLLDAGEMLNHQRASAAFGQTPACPLAPPLLL